MKAILVAQQHKPLPKGRDGHDLLGLYQLAGIEVSLSQRALLDVLTGAILWVGKYPVPTKPGELRRYTTLAFAQLLIPSVDEERTYRSSRALDWKPFDALWKKGQKMYLSALRSPAAESP